MCQCLPKTGSQMNVGSSHVGKIQYFKVRARREVNKIVQTQVTALSKIYLKAGQMVSVLFMFHDFKIFFITACLGT